MIGRVYIKRPIFFDIKVGGLQVDTGKVGMVALAVSEKHSLYGQKLHLFLNGYLMNLREGIQYNWAISAKISDLSYHCQIFRKRDGDYLTRGVNGISQRMIKVVAGISGFFSETENIWEMILEIEIRRGNGF